MQHIENQNVKHLKLVLKYKWFDMIKSGVKLEEYRSIKPSIVSLLFNWRDSHYSIEVFR